MKKSSNVNINDAPNSERGEILEDDIDTEEVRDTTPSNNPPALVQMEEGKNGRFKRVILTIKIV